ncbi:MAG: sulfatase [Phycisphaerae bacterium]
MPGKPNIVLIYCDELRADALGPYAASGFQPRTPNVNRLAERGVVFENNFCNAPICVASRTSLLTSTYCEQHGLYGNEGVWPGFEHPPEMITFPEVFVQAGYTTANFGKYHVPDSIHKWDHCDTTGGGMNLFDDYLQPHSLIMPPGHGGRIGGRLVEDAPFPAEQLTEKACSWIDAQDSPWLCRFSYLQPHTPVFPPQWAVQLIEGDPALDGEIAPPGEGSRFEQRFGEVVNAAEMPPEQVRLTRVYYHALVAWIDSQVGRILDYLEQSGGLDETIVVLEADHGAALGEYGRYAKHVFAPEVHRVPRIIAFPEALSRGERRPDICESIDLGPTLLGLAECDMPALAAEQFQGRDLFSQPQPEAVFAAIGQGHPHSRAFPNGNVGTWRDGEGWPRRSCLRTQRYRLDRNERINDRPTQPEERDVFLCDWQRDPHEQINLASDPAHAQILARLTALLDAHVADSVETCAPSGPS